MLDSAAAHPIQMAKELNGGAGTEACNELEKASGSILFADRGTCNFLNKTLRAFDADASGMVTSCVCVCICVHICTYVHVCMYIYNCKNIYK